MLLSSLALPLRLTCRKHVGVAMESEQSSCLKMDAGATARLRPPPFHPAATAHLPSPFLFSDVAPLKTTDNFSNFLYLGTDRGGCAFGENGGIDFSLSRLAALLVGLPKRQPIQWHGTQINLLMRLSLPFSLGATIIQFVRNQMRSAKNTSHRHRKSRVGLAQEECLPLK